MIVVYQKLATDYLKLLTDPRIIMKQQADTKNEAITSVTESFKVDNLVVRER